MDEIAKLAVQTVAGKDWHKLSTKQRELVEQLEKSGYLTKNNPPNGFVGEISNNI